MPESSTGSPEKANFEDYNSQLQASVLKATRNAAYLPHDLNFYRSMDKGLAKEVDTCSSRVLTLANRLLDLASTGDSSASKAKERAVLAYDDITDNFRSSVVDSMDKLLERAVSGFCLVYAVKLNPYSFKDICLDDFMGLFKAPAIAVSMKPTKPKVCSL